MSATTLAAIDAPPAPVLANPTDPIGGEFAATVGQRMTDWLKSLYREQGDDLRFKFADRDKKELDLAVGQDKLIFTIGAGVGLGRVPVTVQRLRGAKILGTSRLTVDITKRQLAVVAVRAIDKGAIVVSNDIEIREVYLDREPHRALTRLDEAIGRVASTSLREGAVLNANAIRSALLVQRNDLILVQAVAGGLVIETRARAMEDGADGQMIQARNERSREVFAVRVSGSRQAILVADEAPSAGESGQKPAKNKAKPQGEH